MRTTDKRWLALATSTKPNGTRVPATRRKKVKRDVPTMRQDAERALADAIARGQARRVVMLRRAMERMEAECHE